MRTTEEIDIEEIALNKELVQCLNILASQEKQHSSEFEASGDEYYAFIFKCAHKQTQQIVKDIENESREIKQRSESPQVRISYT